MDPRHPEQAISRMRELMKQYDRVESDMKEATTSANLAELEREASLVVQEICLVAPRLHEAMMQTSRQRRHDLAHGVLDEPQDTAVELGIRTKFEQPFEPVIDKADVIGEENIGGESGPMETPHDGYLSVDEIIEEIPTPPNQAETVIMEPKPRKKTTKQKTTKKAKK